MLAFLLRRLLQAVIVMIAVAFIAFMLFQRAADPVGFLGQDARAAQVRQLRIELAVAAAVVAIAVVIPMGVYSALRRGLIFVVSHLAVDPRLRVGNAGGY
jgi:ABC-type dipeptide/oligopeptide/nickel transport system permease component